MSGRAPSATSCSKRPHASLAEVPVQFLLMNAAVDLMPDFAREMHRLAAARRAASGARGDLWLARTLRWAFAGEHYRASALIAGARRAWQSRTTAQWRVSLMSLIGRFIDQAPAIGSITLICRRAARDPRPRRRQAHHRAAS